MMTDVQLTATQRAYLFLLMAEAREISNAELKNRYGISITGVDSAALVDNKLATVRQDGRSLAHDLTDDGWAHARRIMASDYVKPQGANPASAALHSIAAAIYRYIQRSQSSAADIFVPTAPPPPTAPPAKAKPGRKPKAGEKIDVQARIRNAYKRLRKDSIIWVGLTDLRANLDFISKADMDRALLQLLEKRRIRLIPEENQKTITAADRDAAIVVSGEPKHLIAFGA